MQLYIIIYYIQIYLKKKFRFKSDSFFLKHRLINNYHLHNCKLSTYQSLTYYSRLKERCIHFSILLNTSSEIYIIKLIDILGTTVLNQAQKKWVAHATHFLLF